MAILWMVLVINSRQVIWTYLCWMTTLLSKTNGRQNAMIIWQTMKKGLQICPSAFECVSEYTFFIAYTLLYMALKTMILPVWTPISGLLWWYSFYLKILEDAEGRSLLEIFRNPNTGHSHEFLLPQERKRNPHSHRYRFPGTSRAEPMPTCLSPINHRGNYKKQEYFDIELPPHQFVESINKSVHWICNEHPNARFFHTWNIILASLWLCMGHRILTLIFLIFNRWKEKLTSRFSARLDRPLPLKLWKHYRKRKQHGKKQKGRIQWDRVALTSAYNVDDKVKQSNGTSILDTDASFVVCDNSANTHIFNNRDIFSPSTQQQHA